MTHVKGADDLSSDGVLTAVKHDGGVTMGAEKESVVCSTSEGVSKCPLINGHSRDMTCPNIYDEDVVEYCPLTKSSEIPDFLKKDDV